MSFARNNFTTSNMISKSFDGIRNQVLPFRLAINEKTE